MHHFGLLSADPPPRISAPPPPRFPPEPMTQSEIGSLNRFCCGLRLSQAQQGKAREHQPVHAALSVAVYDVRKMKASLSWKAGNDHAERGSGRTSEWVDRASAASEPNVLSQLGAIRRAANNAATSLRRMHANQWDGEIKRLARALRQVCANGGRVVLDAGARRAVVYDAPAWAGAHTDALRMHFGDVRVDVEASGYVRVCARCPREALLRQFSRSQLSAQLFPHR